MSRSCHDMGVCQSRRPACNDCHWNLAPGTVDGPYTRRRASKGIGAFLVKAVLVAALVASLSLTIGFTAGWIVGGTP